VGRSAITSAERSAAARTGTVRPERGPYHPDRIEDRVDTPDPNNGLVEPRERSTGSILADCRRPYRQRLSVTEAGERRPNRGRDLHGQRRHEEGAAQAQRRVPDLFPAHGLERFSTELHVNLAAQPRTIDEAVVGSRR
jgi:hypothetical protein